MFRSVLPLNSLLTRSTRALQFLVLKNAGFPNFFLRNKTYDFAKNITYTVTQNYWERERIQILSCLCYGSIASLTNR